MEHYEKKHFESKKEFYSYLNRNLEAMVKEEPDWLANLSNSAALLGVMFEEINWAGFYLYKNEELVLGPFWGNPACTHIDIGEGVCGTAADTREIQIVKNVHDFPGHIACDSASMSEIVLPIISANGDLQGVLDIDSPILARFNDDDADGLKETVKVLLKYVDWQKIY